MDNVVSLKTREQIRLEALQEAWNAINAWIKPGDLGHLANERRNGMVLAANEVWYLMHPERRLKWADELAATPPQ